MGARPDRVRLPAPTRWVGVGHAAQPDPAVAARAAVAGAVGGRDDPRLLLAFGAVRYDLPVLAAALAAAAPGVPVVGCTTGGELAPSGAHDDSLVVAALGGPAFSVSTAAMPDTASDLRAAGVEAAAALGDVAERPYRVLLLLSDGLAGGDQQELVRGAYSVAGAGVPLFGACAGDGPRTGSCGQIHDGRALHRAVVAAAIGSDAPLGIGVGHGWRSTGDPLHVTGTDGADVLTLDDLPALDVYLERLDAPADVRRDPAAFRRFAGHRPLGVRRRAGEEHVRAVIGADFERRSLRTPAELPQGGLAWVMRHDPDDLDAAGRRACADAVDGLAGSAPLGLLAFGSVARKGLAQEPSVVAGHARGAPVAGFYGHGEIARSRGVTGFHTHGLAVLAVG